jgi:hypothetical protein
MHSSIRNTLRNATLTLLWTPLAFAGPQAIEASSSSTWEQLRNRTSDDAVVARRESSPIGTIAVLCRVVRPQKTLRCFVRDAAQNTSEPQLVKIQTTDDGGALMTFDIVWSDPERSSATTMAIRWETWNPVWEQ